MSRSSAKVEYRGVANAVAKTSCCGIFFESSTLLYILPLWFIVIMSVWFIYLSMSCRMNAQIISRLTFTLFEIRLLLVKFAFLHVPSRYHYVDICTKGLPPALFDEFRTSFTYQCHPAPTAGGC